MAFRDDIRNAGVLGAGGAGFPAFVKLGAKARTFIINGAECEPPGNKDWTVLTQRAADVVTAAAAIREEIGAADVVLAVKGPKARSLGDLFGGVKIHPLADVYPAGDEPLLIYDVTGQRVPAGALPVDVGVVVHNAETVYHIGRALRRKPVTTTWVTVSGAVASSFTAEVPVGTPASDLVAEAGGAKPGSVFLAGGPMMGEEIDPRAFGVTPATTAIIALPAANPAIKHRRLPLAHVKTMAGSACTQCRDCTDMCPRYLMGYDVTPHISMRRFFGWEEGDDVRPFANAAACTSCGLCELYACPMGISPRRVQAFFNARLKGTRREEGEGRVHADRPGRLVPADRLKRRLDAGGWDREAPFRGLSREPLRVIISIEQPYAAALTPAVREGENVEAGQEIAAPAAGDGMGVPVHASIAGRVSSVSPTAITIDRNQAAGR